MTSSTAVGQGPPKLLVANRGEIAVRILRTAQRLGIRTLSVYTQSDATAPHVVLADEAVALRHDDTDPLTNSRGYLDAALIADISVAHQVTLVHPGYGFLSENAEFAELIESKGITWLGPRPETIKAMGLKHTARSIAIGSGVPIVPGSTGLVHDLDTAKQVCEEVGYPIMLKSTAGGGGMGLVVCNDAIELSDRFPVTQARAKSLFHNDGLFIEKYFPTARHIEVQVFGNGLGEVIHMGERECSVQRRYQKVIEEAPSPFLSQKPDLRERICKAAVAICKAVYYASAGTVEFLVEDPSGEFFFLEMNTRLQVEHTVTEATHPGLDMVELMILQGIAQRESSGGLKRETLDQSKYGTAPDVHAIEARVYCENTNANFKPTPGILQYVHFPTASDHPWLRVDTWVETGTTITPYFDPLVAKIVVSGRTREEAIRRLDAVLVNTRICGPPNNLLYLKEIVQDEVWKSGRATTTFLRTFHFTPRAVDVLSGGIETSIQDFPGRKLGMGMPRSGPMDSLAHRVANALVGNAPGVETLEITLVGCRLLFHAAAVVAVTGAPVKVTIDGQRAEMWTRLYVPAGTKFNIGTIEDSGFRAYLAVEGGFPDIPEYLGSKSTSMGLAGYQGRALTAGDQIVLSSRCGDEPDTTLVSVPEVLIPTYPAHWTIGCLAGPHCDEDFLTSSGIEDFFAAKWTISASSNRMGIRLEGPPIGWARANGGEGGSHPSNIHDNGYALGTINLNGDTPVILTNEGPDMGGYLCLCTVATAERWKLGQLRPGNTVQFKRISYDKAVGMLKYSEFFLNQVIQHGATANTYFWHTLSLNFPEYIQDPKIHIIHEDHATGRPRVIFRQAGDSAILVEYGDWILDFNLRARVHALEQAVQRLQVPGIWAMSPCIRSTMIHYDPLTISQNKVLAALIEAEESIPANVDDMVFPGRKLTFPLVLDDSWSKEALTRYMQSIRDEAAYLPSNIEYLARNNGLDGGAQEALDLLVRTDWLVFGVGFYLACPFLVPIDPRCRLVGQKMNPSRTYTPRGALGIAGLVAAIYPIQSPGGYQLFGRTLPPWQTWGRGKDFSPEQPWLLRPFDQVTFKVIDESQYIELEKQFDSGQYAFRIEPATFSMKQYNAFVESIQDEVRAFKARQAEGVAREEAKESELLAAWTRRRQESLDLDQENSASMTTAIGEYTIKSSLSATVWKVNCQPGDVVQSAEDVLVVLEAMKTEVNVTAGEDNVGRKVVSLAPGVKHGSLVHAGEVLVVLE